MTNLFIEADTLNKECSGAIAAACREDSKTPVTLPMAIGLVVTAIKHVASRCRAQSESVDSRLSKLAEHLAVRDAELEQRIAELEARPTLAYEGIWSADDEYKSGEAVTFAGSLWICREPATTSKPGTDDSWQLAVKRGRDGRNAA